MTESTPPYRILAIDDDPVDLQLVRRHLGKATTFEFEYVAVTSPMMGVGKIHQASLDPEESQFDVILLDYLMGAETGFDVLEEIRRIDADLPVIFLTGLSDKSTLSEMIRVGVSDYIPKGELSSAVLERSVGNAVEKGRMHREIEGQREDLVQLVAELQSRDKETQSFYHVLSHELKTPLTAIREFVSLTLDGLGGEVTPEQREFLEVAMRNCSHLKTMLNDLIDVTRMETGKLAVLMSELNVQHWVENTVQLHRAALEAGELSLSIEVEEGLAQISGDGERLAQVLTNLLTNAIKFTDPGGSITVLAKRSTAESEMVEISVRDNGCGMAPEQAERIFERLYQVKEEDYSIQGGLGLGLNICEGLVRSHGGRIWVESTPGEGACFTFLLPFIPQIPIARAG